MQSFPFLGDLTKALHSFIKYRELSEDFENLKTDASIQLTRLYMKLAQRRTDAQSLQYVVKAYEASAQSKTTYEKNILILFLFVVL